MTSAVHTISSVSGLFRAALFKWLVAGLLTGLIASPVDESKPYGRVCIGVVTGDIEAPLQASSRPGAGTHIVVHVDANQRCQVLVFAFNARSGKLAYDWPPQLVELSRWQEVLLPEPSGAWKWSADLKPFDIYALFSDPNFEDTRNLNGLVTAMRSLTTNRELLDQQSVKLLELATRSGATQAEVIRMVKAGRVEVAATYRGSTFPWRDYASRANFSETKPALLVFRVGD